VWPDNKLIDKLAFSLILVVSLGLNVGLTFQTLRLTELVRQLKADQRLSIGQHVPPLRGTLLGQGSTTVSFDGSAETIFYLFSPKCIWCTRNLANIQVLARNVQPSRRLIGISLLSEGLPEYMKRNGITFPVIYEVPSDLQMVYHLGATPQTILVSPEGAVLRVWGGAYQGDLAREIESFFHVRLPGLSPLSAPGAILTTPKSM